MQRLGRLKKFKDGLKYARQLEPVLGLEGATTEVRWMKEYLEARSKETGTPFSTEAWASMVEKRAAGTPLQYLLGTQPFGPLDIMCRPPVLIPRPETEHWVTRLAERIRPDVLAPISMLDLCTGTGCIPLLLAHLWPPRSVRALGVDVSPDAVRLARENALENETSRSELTFVEGDLFDPDFAQKLPADPTRTTLLTCNPPYISAEDYDALPLEVRDHEDRLALRGDPPGSTSLDGLSFYRRIAGLLPDLVSPGGTVAFEFGMGQGEAVGRIMALGVEEQEIWQDQFGRDRVLIGRRTVSGGG